MLVQSLENSTMISNNGTPNDKFCILPWIHVNLWPSGDVHPCCLGDWQNPVGNVKDNTIKEIVNGEPLREMRKQMMSGQAPASCDRCFGRERLDISSLRQEMNRVFAHHTTQALANTNPDYTLKDVRLKYWDFRFSNLCNMKCRMCGTGFSSLWYDDEVAMGMKNINKRLINANEFSKQDLIDFVDENIHDVEYIYFAGGEPLIMDEHYYILEKLIEIGKTDVILRYNTNGLKLNFKKYNVIDMWKNFSNVHVLCSVDSYQERAEYVRHGTRWNAIVDNLKELNAASSISLSIEVTTSLFNIYTLPELFDHLMSIGISASQIQTHNILQTPLYYHSAILREQDKTAIHQKINNYIEGFDDFHKTILTQKFSALIEHMNEDIPDVEHWRKVFKNKTDMLDRLRNENFNSVFTELNDFYNSISND